MQKLQTIQKLCGIITEVTGQNKQTQLPESTSDQQLAKELATFFFNKIQKIRKLFESISAYILKPNHTPQVERFSTLIEQGIYQTIIGIPSKSYALNTIPTTFLREVLKHCLPSMAKLVNLSLDTGEFCKRWKSTVLQPCIKAIRKGTGKTNYRPVTNISFISRIIEKVYSQSTNHTL